MTKLIPSMLIVNVSGCPDQPEKVLGVIGVQCHGLTADFAFGFKTWSGKTQMLTLEGHPLCVEPLVGVVARLLSKTMLLESHRPAGPATFARMSIYGGRSVSESTLLEHLVVTAKGHVLDIELCDDLDETRRVAVAAPGPGMLPLLKRGVRHLLWAGQRPPSVAPLSAVVVSEAAGDARVLERDIPPYARRRLLHSMGGFQGPACDAFYASDWLQFLDSFNPVGVNGEGSTSR